MLAFFQNDFGFGGNNGLTDFKDILGKDISSKETRAALYICSATMLILSYLTCRFIVSSKIGNILITSSYLYCLLSMRFRAVIELFVIKT